MIVLKFTMFWIWLSRTFNRACEHTNHSIARWNEYKIREFSHFLICSHSLRLHGVGFCVPFAACKCSTFFSNFPLHVARSSTVYLRVLDNSLWSYIDFCIGGRQTSTQRTETTDEASCTIFLQNHVVGTARALLGAFLTLL